MRSKNFNPRAEGSFDGRVFNEPAKKSGSVSYILYFSTFPPRECGIATFTRDLTSAMDKKFNPSLKSKILAINDNGSSIYNYNQKVKYQIDETDIESYINIAKKINNDSAIRLVNIQHEFGIFGGIFGDYLITFLEAIKKPVVVTFHTVIPKPNEKLKKVIEFIFNKCAAIVVMADTAVKIFEEDYGIKKGKIKVIPHGVPTIPFQPDNINIKKKLGFKNKAILSTFGLINRGKGIEYVIQALPKIVKKNPNILYLVIGETHPQVRKREGEAYRNKLVKLVKKFNLTAQVKFYNKYLSLREITDYLRVTDIYICPSLSCNQITSGTLAYALSASKAIIATPSLYAKEVLAKGRGILVNFKDAPGIIKAVNLLLTKPELKRKKEKESYAYSRKMLWPNVAAEYLEVFRKIVNISNPVGLYKFPALKINYLLDLTDEVGIIQHAKHSVKDRSSGYTVDDNARALIAAVMYQKRFRDQPSLKLINTYLSFLYHAQKKDGWFHNLMDYDRKFLDQVGSEDCFGQALWATGFVVASNLYQNTKMTAKLVFDKAVKNVPKLNSPRSLAFSILGLYYYYQKFPNQDILRKIEKLADHLVTLYKNQSTKDWRWFEKIIAYQNGRLPESLFLAYEITKNKEYFKVAQESLDFLASLVILENKLVLIGQGGWYNYKGKRAYFDQQPVDAASMVQVFLTAWRVTKDESYYEKAGLSFSWFLGRNSIGQFVYDEVTGGCFDGLLPACVNLNQGAESTISYLLARMSFDV